MLTSNFSSIDHWDDKFAVRTLASKVNLSIVVLCLTTFSDHGILRGQSSVGASIAQEVDDSLVIERIKTFIQFEPKQLYDAANSVSLNDSVLSAWQLVRVGRDGEIPPIKEAGPVHGFQWFIGFVEGRCRVKVPHLWQHALVSGHFKETDFIPMVLPNNEAGNGVYWDPVLERICQEGVKVVNLGSHYEVEFDDLTFRTPEGVWKNNVMRRGVAATIRGDHGFLVFYEQYYALSTRIRCYHSEKRDENEEWSKGILGSGPAGASGETADEYGDTWRNLILLESSPEAVFVFGIQPKAIFLEAFSIKDGKRILYFSSKLWSKKNLGR